MRLDTFFHSRLQELSGWFRPTPMASFKVGAVQVFAKLEFRNPVGSIKDRTAYWILKSAIERGDIQRDSTIVESSSGNMAISLAHLCRFLELRFIPVIDPNITSLYERELKALCPEVIKVQERDDTGGYLKTRLAAIQRLQAAGRGRTFWTNQYANEDAVEAHYQMTGREICQDLPHLDFAFIGVSTGGTLAGVSRRLRERYPAVRIIAVDAEGSVIFGAPPRKRFIPGLGSSIVPPLVARAQVDEVVHVPEREVPPACRRLRDEYGVDAGGSSGSCFGALSKYRFPAAKEGRDTVAVFLCADGGAAYRDSVYDAAWCRRLETE